MTKYLDLRNNYNKNDLLVAAQYIKEGKLVLFPTETVYGIGANGLDDNAVKSIGTEPVSIGLFPPIRLFCLHNLVPLLPEPIHLHNFLRRMLQIAVDHHAAIALGRCQTGIDCGFLSEIPGEFHTPNKGMFFPCLFDCFPGAVP